MFGMEVFCTFPSNYVEAQKHGNERRITIGDFNSQARRGRNPPDRETYETLWTRKRTLENGRIKWRYTAASKTGQSCSNIQLLNEDEASLNQLGNDTSCYGGERAWINSKNT
ncbi:unnamed protein product [Microthlaspi erraticum]|uniref:Uncharacterized protein n=1 Tax=Microthlaspi erraticum TaxID=1685480 RepID=A0A6D2K2T4_9BRAS|nr:unnamed protein product [Microthlaspi erraticum]